jgi:single-strand selective monofunctional uracil DNA glycosylase
MSLAQITGQLLKDLEPLRFGPPVTHVYNPLTYAGKAYARYLALYGQAPKEVLLLGMNPGPWGMAQTGVPFGEVRLVRDWLGIEVPIGAPAQMHPKRPVTGFACTRSEVSGARLWGWVRETFQTPKRFFARFFVANYCPLIFVEASGRNRTPDRLSAAERGPLLAACDRALRRSVEVLAPRHVVGVGKFAETRALQALAGLPVTIGRLTHPSPANPAANRGWGALAARELAELGICLETPRDP